MDEKTTREQLIDPQLKKAGWKEEYVKKEVNSIKSNFKTKKYIYFSGSVEKDVDRFIDYLLLAEDNSPLAIVEAKKSSVSFYKGRIQAETYAKDVEKQIGKKIPIFLTNGYEWFFIDEEMKNERKVSGVFTQEDLVRRREMFFNRRNPSEINLDSRIVDRERSIIIVKKLAEHFQAGHRSALVNMATGTGKTRVAMAIIDLLIKSNYVKNVLFVVDRISLADQAKSTFSEFFNEPLTELNREGFSSTKRFYVSTVQTLMGGKGTFFKQFSPGFFDLIVFDEAHRSYFGKPDVMIKYFDALNIGLTATPSSEDARDTFKLFGCDYKKPTVIYDYYDAVNDNVLAPYNADVIETKVLSLGIEGKKLSSNLKTALMKQEENPEYLELPGAAFERVFMDEKTNELIVREYIDRCYKSNDGKPCKTIFFCASIRHAQALKKVFTKLDPEISKEVRVVTSDMTRYMDQVKRFKIDSEPRIALSVGILDTGIDIPEICNLVFVKPVFSSIRFWQMLGRGTRNIKACKHRDWLPVDENENPIKNDFLIMDFKFGDHSNVKFHKLSEEGKEKSPSLDAKTKIFLQRVNLLSRSLNPEQKKVIEGKILDTINTLDKDSFVIREKLPIIKKVTSRKFDLKEHIKDLKDEIAPLLIFTPSVNSKISSFIFKVEKLYKGIIEDDDELIRKIEEYVKERLKNILLKQNLEAVKNKSDEMKKVFQEKFWEDMTMENIDFLIREIAPLMVYYSPTGKRILQVDAPDWIIGEEKVKMDIKKDEKFDKFISSNKLIKKIKEGKGVTSKELLEIEAKLSSLNPNISIENVQKIERVDFLVFLHRILGLTEEYDPVELIKREFDKYLSEKNKNYTSKQLEFISLLKKVFIDRKHIELKDFAKHPFDKERPFEVAELKELVVICDKIRMK